MPPRPSWRTMRYLPRMSVPGSSSRESMSKAPSVGQLAWLLGQDFSQIGQVFMGWSPLSISRVDSHLYCRNAKKMEHGLNNAERYHCRAAWREMNYCSGWAGLGAGKMTSGGSARITAAWT